MSRREVSSGGIGLTGAVFLVFLVLKLIGEIDWSWWWVTSPLWIPIGLFFAIVGAVFIFAWPVALIGSVLETRQRNKRLADQFRRMNERRGGYK